MTFDETTRAITRITLLQTRLLDHAGAVRPELTQHSSRRLVSNINALRRAVGWRALNMSGR